MHSFTDQLGRNVTLAASPKKIVSIVPSQTELLYDLGLDDAIAGITCYCVHPPGWLQQKRIVGGTKKLDMQAIAHIHPDFILANKEENDREQVEALAQHYPVWISDVHHLEDALQMIAAVGAITGKSDMADNLIQKIRDGFSMLKKDPGPRSLRAAYLIWRKPYMAAGGDNFIHDMMQCCGLQNVFGNYPRYPVIDLPALQTALRDGGLLLLSSEPYPFSQKHVEELQGFLPGARIFPVDGEMFSWYGSRLVHAPAYFRELLYEMQQ